jgi:hypothetical protein
VEIRRMRGEAKRLRKALNWIANVETGTYPVDDLLGIVLIAIEAP